jgi:hypothetical protein
LFNLAIRYVHPEHEVLIGSPQYYSNFLDMFSSYNFFV